MRLSMVKCFDASTLGKPYSETRDHTQGKRLMTTSPTPILSKPQGEEQISLEAFAYMRARAKRRAYDLVMEEFRRSGLTKIQLARRLFGSNKGADRVSRMLGGPGNWTIKTLSDLLFAISGAEPTYGVAYPLDKAKRNFTGYNKFQADHETFSTVVDVKISTHEQNDTPLIQATYDLPSEEEFSSPPVDSVINTLEQTP
jgi:hypothetical protein